MEIVFYIIASTAAMVAWFFLIMKIAKHTVGKNASTPLMFLIMIVSGPLGWASLLFALAWDLVEKVPSKK